MISNKDDYKRFLAEDEKHLFSSKQTIVQRIRNPIWKYERVLRKCEFLRNTTKHPYRNPLYLLNKMRLNRLGIKLGFSISENCFAEGLSIAHYGCIIVNPNAKIGKNCRIHVGVNIGSAADSDETPVIGDNVYIGPGAKIFGGIVIGNNTVIGANAVVNKSFPEGGVTIGGIPAKIISAKSSDRIMNRNSL